MVNDPKSHWDVVWADRDPATKSWFEASPATSLELIARSQTGADEPIVDVGGGTSGLAQELAERGYRDITVIDIAASALALLDEQLHAHFGVHDVGLVVTDVLAWTPGRTYGLWHDRAVNHFLTDQTDRAVYVALAGRTIRRGGHLLLAAFAPDGPERCSGLIVHCADAATLAAEFDADFDLISVRSEVHETPWHDKQSFHYLLLRRR
jgi:trans-aconitate methyltransferase